MKTAKTRKDDLKTLYFVSLGCDKNLVDSEHILYDLQQNGYVLTDDASEAEVILINTCCFIGDALEESIETVLSMNRYREDGKLKALAICGCMAERFFSDIETQLPEVDAVIGVFAYDRLAEVLDEALKGQKVKTRSDDYTANWRNGRLTTGPTHSAYLKIAEGCMKHCSYCVIPSVRGAYCSVPMEELIEEANRLVEGGATELCIIAQETTCYGIDIDGTKKLPELLRALSTINDLKWIRLFYAYPEEITDELIEEMANNPKICHYIDMPIQHCNDKILQKMGRKTDKKSILEIVQKLRKAMPDITIRTTLIAGFPGESEEQVEELIDFIHEIKFDRLGAFSFSPEEGTKAYDFDDQIDEAQKEYRYRRIMEAQQIVAFQKEQDMVGKTLPVIVDGFLPEDDVYIGRTYRDAPDIDGVVFFESEQDRITGDFVNVTITGAKDYDLTGEIAT